METLTGERVRLRTMTPEDAPAIFALFSDPEAMRYWSYPPYTERVHMVYDAVAATRD